jgi:CBS domain containing-hemolysin-like protein
MNVMVACVAALVVLGAVLAMAEASISRMTRVRAAALKEGGRRNAALLEQIELDPAPYLNSIYLAVMLAQNGSAILVARLASWYFDDLGITLLSVGYTLAYFIVVEAMAKTFGILHSDRVALALAPVVWVLGRILAWPTRALIGIANILLPGKGLKQGPFVSPQDIRSMAEVGHEEGVIEETEKEMIHSIFAFGDTLVREVMVPRPDVVAVEADRTVDGAMELVLSNKFSRVPVYRGDLDHIVGVLHEKDILAALYAGQRDRPVTELVRPAHFVPETSRAAALLRRMQREQFHMAMVVDEHGSTSGLVTLENLLEELVGNIADEHDVDEEKDIERLADGTYRVDASVSIRELNDLLGTEFPRERWNTVGGLMFGVLGTIPTQGEAVSLDGWRFTAEKVQGRRVTTVLVHRDPASVPSEEE